MNRREALRALGWSAAGITVAFSSACRFIPPIPKRPASRADDLVGWVQLTPAGRVLVVSPRHEIGQNIFTVFRQIVAEELEIAPELIDVRPHSTRGYAPVRSTVGSESVMDCTAPLARAAAALRGEIELRAAALLNTAVSELSWRTEGGLADANGRTVSLPDVANAGAGVVLTAPPADDLSTRTFGAGPKTYIGVPAPLVNGREIVTGAPLYANDLRFPGMLYGTILRAPRPSSRAEAPVDLDEAAAARVPGFVRVVRAKVLQGEVVGVVTRKPWQLRAVVAALAPRWSETRALAQSDLDRAVDVDRALQQGNLRHDVLSDKVQESAPWTVDLRFDVPLAAHAAIEARAALATYRTAGSPRLEVWAGTQDAFFVRAVLARVLDLSSDSIVVHGMRVGGAFGGRAIPTVEIEAAILSRACEAPVKVVWSREEEFSQSFYRPPSAHRVRVRLSPDGRITDWRHALLSSHIMFSNAVLPAWLQRGTDFVGDDGVSRGAHPPYAADRARVDFDAVRLPVHTGPWRGLGAAPNVFAIESAIDEAARAVGRDPVAVRLANIEPQHDRLRACLERAAALAKPIAVAGQRRGRGFACGVYKGFSFVAVAADVAVANDGNVRVLRMLCVLDCGRVLNPDGVRAQTEGNLVWGIGMVLKEQLSVENGDIAQKDFFHYRIATIADVPEIDVHFIQPPGAPPAGAGESAIVASGAAVANAIRDATGLRVLRLPLDPAALRAHLGAQLRP